MGYRHDIFISYKRHPETLEWIKKHFLPLLNLRVGLELGEDPQIYVLVVPVVVHDGEKIPPTLGLIQRLDVKDCFNTRMRSDGPKAEELSDRIQQHAQGIAQAIAHAPEWQKAWPLQAAQQLFNTYYDVSKVSQDSLPRFLGK